MHINTEKSYLIGLLIGGAIIKSDQLQIILPYKKWGDLKINPERGGGIAEDILKKAGPLWKQHYGVDVTYKIDKDWKIVFNNLTEELKNDLQYLDLLKSGEFRNSADITKLIPLLDNTEKIRSFIAGIVDTVGSLAKSHRRFSDEFQIVSLELKGRNYFLVRDITSLLIKMGCTPDQVLWNHPNQHSGLDRYYKQWKKGFKIRVALGDYMLKGSFVFESKQLSAKENHAMQKETNTSLNKKANIGGRTCFHMDEYSEWLPPYIRGFHFVHYAHIAEHLGLNIPSARINEVTEFEKYICPFTLLTKGTNLEIKTIISKEEYLAKTKYKYVDIDIKKLLRELEANSSLLIYGNSKKDGFLINYVIQAIAYVFASSTPEYMKGKRILGSYVDLIKQNIDSFGNVKIGIPDRGTCLLITNGKNCALVGYINDEYNKTLIKVDGNKLKIHNPEYQNCVILDKYERQ